MKDLMKNKLALAGITAVLVVLVVAGVIFMQNRKSSKAPQVQTSPEEQATMIKPEEIGLVLTPNSSNTEVVMEINNVSAFTSFEYDMNYEAEVNGETVTQGATGSGDVKPGETSIKRSVTIGTCSAGKCRYDKGVKKVSFEIRLNLKDGKTALVKKDLNLSGE